MKSGAEYHHAVQLLQSGRLVEAKDLLQKLRRTNASNLDVQYLFGVVLLLLNEFSEAEKTLRKVVAAGVKNDQVFSNYGFALKNIGKPNEALEQFRNAIKLNPNNPVNFQNAGSVLADELARYDEAVSFFQKAIDADRNYFPAYCSLGNCLSKIGDYERALSSFNQSVSINPGYWGAWLGLGNVLSELRRYDQAFAAYDRALSIKADLEAVWLGRAHAFSDLRRYDDALAAYDKALAIQPDLAEAWLGRGHAFNDLKRHDEAFAAYDRALAIKADLAEAWLGRGHVFSSLKRRDEAFAAYDRALALNADLAEAWLGRGNLFYDLKRHDDAFAAYDKALSLKSDLAAAWLGRGNVFYDHKRHDDALMAYDKALSIRADLSGAWLGRGNVFYDLRRYDDALATYDKALSIRADAAEAWLGLGNVFGDLKRYGEALAAYDKALSIKADAADAWLGRGNIFGYLMRYDEALAAYDKALSINPNLAGAWLGRGHAFSGLKRYDEAFPAYDKTMSLNPDLGGVEGARLHAKVHLHQWSNLDQEISHLIEGIRAGKVNCPPFLLLALTDSREDQLQCASVWSSKEFPESSKPMVAGTARDHGKIRLGYASADFNIHPVAFLIAELFELHDRSRFETIGFSFGSDDQSEIRARLEKSFDKFVECRAWSDSAIAEAVAREEIDILIDLNGFTQNARTSVFAGRPAPIQVNYLGYPGTMGAPYIDYIIGDHTLFGADDTPFYTEKLVCLPHTYQSNDRMRKIADKSYSRAELGLPPDAFVFCCFNNNFKILPEMFDVWMRILNKVDGSVLWLLADKETAKSNLRREAQARGLDPDRLVFAPRIKLPDHLARHRCADLFLDTFPYNAHTTASDSLWAGLPVLTLQGKAFAGRVAASLLNAVALPELVTQSLAEYEARAIDLALDRPKLQAVREKLDRNRLTAPLFDTVLYTKHLEAAYETMYQRYRSGQAPDTIVVAPIP